IACKSRLHKIHFTCTLVDMSGTVAQVLALPPHSSGGLSPGPFCVEFACSPRVHKGFPPPRTPTEKNMQKEQNTLRPSSSSGSPHLVPACVCVCPVSPPCIHACAAVWQ